MLELELGIQNLYSVIGIFLMATGAIGVVVAVVMEWRTQAELWEIIMKVMPLVWAIGLTFFVLGWG